MKRLLALDGGGIRGVFTLCILERMEQLLQEKYHNPNLTLSDHFHYIGGTSTGAIIATFISWGIPVEEIKQLYITRSPFIFARRSFWQRYKSKFQAKATSDLLKNTFIEDDGSPALLGTEKLKTKLLIVTRNATTGSAWPLTNNPNAKFNRAGTPGNNLKIPLWQIVRSSTAAPTFFPPENVMIYGEGKDFENGVQCSFEDGGITPYNNPAYLLYLKATLPEYCTEWPIGADKLHIVSVGTGFVPLGRDTSQELNLLKAATTIPQALIQSGQKYQDTLCRATGRCLFGAPIDSELGDMAVPHQADPHFTYVRYNHTFTQAEMDSHPVTAKYGLTLDNLALIPFLEKFGTHYAKEYLHLDHLR